MKTAGNQFVIRGLRMLCRRLPPFLGYRLKHVWGDDVIPHDGVIRCAGLFGSGPFDADLSDIVERDFALMGTANFVGMAVAACVLRPGDVVYELGANVGTETISLAKLASRVVAVEALGDNAVRLRSHLEEARVANVILVERAVCNCAGRVNLAPGPGDNRGMAFVQPALPDQALGTSGDVETVGLDQLLDKWGPPRFVCIDIEGAEYSALESGGRLLSEIKPVLLVEIDSSNLKRMGATPDAVLELLERHGYAVYDANRRSLPIIRGGNLGPSLHTDWLAVPNGRDARLVFRIRRTLLLARLMPRVFRLNPLWG